MMKNLSQDDKVFLDLLEREFSQYLDNVYKISICEYRDGTSSCVLIMNQKKIWHNFYNRNFIYDLKGKSGFSLGGFIKSFNFTHVAIESTVFWRHRMRGCQNWRYIK